MVLVRNTVPIVTQSGHGHIVAGGPEPPPCPHRADLVNFQTRGGAESVCVYGFLLVSSFRSRHKSASNKAPVNNARLDALGVKMQVCPRHSRTYTTYSPGQFLPEDKSLSGQAASSQVSTRHQGRHQTRCHQHVSRLQNPRMRLYL